jgi:hypothetical protein
MRNEFRGYYRPTNEEFDALWNNALIIPDANVLLDCYTYSTETWQELFQLLSDLKEQLWIPYQAADEYQRNRGARITTEVEHYTAVLKDLKKVEDALQSRKSHPFIDADLQGQFVKLAEKVKDSMQRGQENHKKLLSDDPIREQITQLFDRRVGIPFSDEELKKFYAEGSQRYEKKIPPGYEDAKKPDPEKYGDLIIWRELMQKASETQKDMIFITRDDKKDWWQFVGSSKIGPRPELLNEFRVETGQSLYIYGTEKFLETAKMRGKAISNEALAEIEAARVDRETHQAARKSIQLQRQAALRELDPSENELRRRNYELRRRDPAQLRSVFASQSWPDALSGVAAQLRARDVLSLTSCEELKKIASGERPAASTDEVVKKMASDMLRVRMQIADSIDE